MPLDILKKSVIPKVVPDEMNEFINELKKSKNKEECLKKAYDILVNRYHGNSTKTLTRLFQLFDKSLDKIWKRKGFLHCTNINYLMRILLIKSGWFQDKEIELKWTLIWYISPHQYLKIKMIDNKYINIDVWGNVYGIKFGDYAHGLY